MSPVAAVSTVKVGATVAPFAGRHKMDLRSRACRFAGDGDGDGVLILVAVERDVGTIGELEMEDVHARVESRVWQ